MTYEFIFRNFANNLHVFFCSLCKNRTVVQKRTLQQNTKQKSKDKDNNSDVQSKADSDEDDDSETVIEKQKHSLHFVKDSPNSTRTTKIRYNVQNFSCRMLRW